MKYNILNKKSDLYLKLKQENEQLSKENIKLQNELSKTQNRNDNQFDSSVTQICQINNFLTTSIQNI